MHGRVGGEGEKGSVRERKKRTKESGEVRGGDEKTPRLEWREKGRWVD